MKNNCKTLNHYILYNKYIYHTIYTKKTTKSMMVGFFMPYFENAEEAFPAPDLRCKAAILLQIRAQFSLILLHTL